MKINPTNIFEMYVENGNCAGFWIRRKSWGNTVARVVSVLGLERGVLPGAPPYHGYSESAVRKGLVEPVWMDVYVGMERKERDQVSCPGTYGYRLLNENEMDFVRRYILSRGSK